jgi:hypothetical protein
MTEGKSPKQEGAKEPLDNPKNKESKKRPCRKSLANECDGMVPRIEEENVKSIEKEALEATRKSGCGAVRRSNSRFHVIFYIFQQTYLLMYCTALAAIYYMSCYVLKR